MPQETLDNTEELELEFSCDRCEADCAEITTVGNESWCNDCADNHSFCCNDCEERVVDVDTFYQNSQDHRICEGCADNYFTCEDCGHTCHNDDYGENGRCSRCAPDEEEDEAIIQSYGDDVSTVPIGKGPHYFGVELEVEVRNGQRLEKAEQCRNLVADFAILKEDGSLDTGFEIVTRPASLEEQRGHWQDFFANKPSGLASFNTATCGLHVHCSRAPLSELTIAKVVCFVNARHNLKFMSVIAGRGPSTWAKYKLKKLGTAAKINPERYEAINLQNRHTIEFRIFKGTLKKESVFKAIEFCDALVSFCAPATRSLRECMMRSEFTEHVRLNAKQWPHLAAFLEAKWYGRTSKETERYGYRPSISNMEATEQSTEEQ